MKVIYVDDERNAHINFEYDLKDRVEVESLICFLRGGEALAYAQANPIDCAFLDVNLGGGQTGIQLAKELKAIQPNLEVVFLTAYDHYARESYRVGGRGYLTKPYTQEELDDILKRMKRLVAAHQNETQSAQSPTERVIVKTFGNFDFLVDGKPVAFKNAKAKELLAFLVHQRGGTVNSVQVFLALWERQEYTATTSTYVRRTARALKDELEGLGLTDIFINKRNCYSVDTTRFTCDYYLLMAGDKVEASHYNGEYMSQYYWGEGTIPLIDRKVQSME